MLLSLGGPLTVTAASLLVFGLDATFWLVSIFSFLLLFALLGLRFYLKRALPAAQQGVVAFFHPNANGGGGGERVLWCGIKSLQEAYPTARVVVYSADGLTGEGLRRAAQQKFGVSIPKPVEVVPLNNAHLVDPQQYPRFTLVGQALGSVRMAFCALKMLRPQVFVDTSGWAFMYPLVRLAGVKVACYTHYPTISTNMLLRVMGQRTMYNNSGYATKSALGALVKLAYYYVFACFYGMAGGCANVVMVNSSWTRKHVRQLWWKLEDPRRVYPPCNTKALQALPLERKLKRLYMVSVAQFRPEKAHGLQLEALALARSDAREAKGEREGSVLAARLVLVGSCRGPADQKRIDDLKSLVKDLGLEDVVEFAVNASFLEVQRWLKEAVGGLHTMLDEHFGISVVEYMAAGVVPIAHNSGGPKEDIVDLAGEGRQPNGFLCESREEYAAAITSLLSMTNAERLTYAAAARRKSEDFSDELFEVDFMQALQPLLLLLDALP